MRLFLIFISLFSVSSLYAKNFDLSMPPKGAAMDTLEPLVEGVVRNKEKVFLTLFARGMFVQVPFNGLKKDQKKTFGSFADSTRIKLTGPLERGFWQGGDVVGNRLVLVDGDMFSLAAFDLEKGTHLATRTIPWDMVRPPRDRGGEPTKVEVAGLRKKFKEAYKVTDSPRIAGIAYDHGKWLGKSGHNFFVATRLKGFPLVTLKCQKDDATACYVARACFIEGKKPDRFEIDGIATDSNRNIYFLDRKKRRFKAYKFHSCFHVTAGHTYTLPQKIKRPSDIFIDSGGGLWVSSTRPDDYYNASVYYWKNEQWQGKK